ncbi:MAG TPA: ABC transporter permease [Thermoanaerobaculia bacterium]|nr:ABC transporter permease [Thermoanaerobaculia bacterium]
MPERYSPLWELTVARTKEFVRQPEALFWVFGFPLLLALALGFAFRERSPERVPVGIAEGAEARRIAAILETSPALQPRIHSEQTAAEALRHGTISLFIRPLEGGVMYVYDPTRPDARSARMEVDDLLQRAAGRGDPLQRREEHVTERGSRYIDFLIPGLLGLNLMGTGMWGVGFSIVTARTQKLLKRLVATPMRKSDYLLSQILSRLVFLVLEVIALVGFGWLVFDVAVRGSLLLLGIVCLLGAMTFSGLGILVASRAETIEAVSGIMNLVMMPMWLLSGVFFSADRFPDWTQPFIRALPLTALNDALRAVMNDGLPITTMTMELAILTIWALASFGAALLIFRWK